MFVNMHNDLRWISFYSFGIKFEPRSKIYDVFLEEDASTGSNDFDIEDGVADLILSVDFKFEGSSSVFALRAVVRTEEIDSPLSDDHRFLQFMWHSFYH